MLAGDLDVRALIPQALSHRAVVFAHTVDEAIDLAGAVGADTLVCSILLSHLTSREACVATVGRLAERYKLIVFIEPSSHDRDYLARHGLKTFHAAFGNNRSMNVLSPDLFFEKADFADLDHFAINVAEDDSAAWLVPLDAPPNFFPAGGSWPPRVVFDRFVFEFSCFLCRRYDAPLFDLASELVLVSTHRKQGAFRQSGAASGISAPLERSGRELYRSVIAPVDQAVADDDGVALSGLVATELEQYWLQNRPGVPFDLRVSLLTDCVVTGRGCVLTKGALVEESDYMLRYLAGPHVVRDSMARRHSIGHIDGLSIVALNIVSSNYYHWFAQVMPALLLARDACKRSGIDEVTIITCEPEPFFEDYIRLVFAGFKNVELVALRQFEYVTTSRTLYGTSLGGGPVDRVVGEHAMFVSGLKADVGVSSGPPFRDIYISRLDTPTRPMANEIALIDSLEERGLETVTLSTMSVAEQIRLFHEARLIVGPHGAGLTNVVFARPGTTLLELGQAEYRNSCFLRLAQAVGVHHIVQFFSVRDAGSAASEFWLADIDAVGSAVDRILASKPAYDVGVAAAS